MSGYAENSAAEPTIIDQNSVWLQKPFSLDSLLHKVQEVLDNQASSFSTQLSG